MAQGHQPNLVADASLCTLRARTVHCRRAGIDHALDLILERHGRLEDRQRADHVNHRPQDWIGAARWRLQPGQMQDVRGLDALHSRPDCLQIGHVPGDEMHLGPLFRIQHQVQTMRVLPEVEDPDVVAPLDQFSGYP
jgi:hypothetical protein